MASAVIGALRVNLSIDTAAFRDGLKGASAALTRTGKSMQAIGNRLSTYVTAPIAAAGTAITAALGGMSSEINSLSNSAKLAGAGFEEFQKLAYGAKTVGIESEKLGDIYKDTQDKIGDFLANGGGEMQDFFNNIAPKVGITADAFRNLSGPQALQLYYDSLQKAGVSQQEMTFYMEAIADEASGLIPLLRNGGAEFKRYGDQAAALGSVYSPEPEAQAKKFSESMMQLGAALRGLGVVIANSGLIEWVTQAVQSITEFMSYLGQTNPEIVKWGTVVAGLAAIIGPAVTALGLMVAAIGAIGIPVAAAIAAVAGLTAAVVAFWPEIQRAGSAIGEFVSGAMGQFRAAWDGVVQKISDVSAAVAQFANDIIAAFQALPAKMMEIGGQIIDGLWNGIKAKWESVKSGVAGIGSSISSSVKSVLGIHSPSTVMHEVGVNIMEGLQNGMESMRGSVAGTAVGTAGDVENAMSGLDQLGQNLSSSIGDLFGAFVEGGDAAKDALKNLAKQLANFALNDGLKALSSAFGGGGSSGGGFGAILGSVFRAIIPGAYKGGSIMPGGGVGGLGGIDNQLVAFRKKPDEQVDIYNPRRQSRSGATSIRQGDIIIQGDASERTIKLIDERLRENNRQLAYAQANSWRGGN